MSALGVPQPSPSRMVPLRDHPLVVGVVPQQPPLLALTAAQWARDAQCSALYFAYVDRARFTREEYADGTVLHDAIDPDGADAGWTARQKALKSFLAEVMKDQGVEWHFRYLAGRPDRALTHLARAVDAAAYVVGTRGPGAGAHVRELVEGSVAGRLSHHQHRPVLAVPLEVVDWEAYPSWPE